MSQYRRQFLKTFASAAVYMATGVTSDCSSASINPSVPIAQGKSVMGLVVAKMDVVQHGK